MSTTNANTLGLAEYYLLGAKARPEAVVGRRNFCGWTALQKISQISAVVLTVMTPISVAFADEATTQSSNQGAIHVNTKDLPHASGKTFETLDQYLAHLKEKGAMDIPYYDLQPDGRYRLITGRGGNRVPPVFFTREELSAKFGFSQ